MISIKNVSKDYGRNKVLDNVCIDIYENEMTFIVGSSGAGKSTLLQLIGGLDKVSSGEIFYDNQDINNDLIKYRADNVGFIFQDYNLISGLSVEKNIELGLAYSNKKKNFINIQEQIQLLGIKDKEQPVQTLSGGEKQRVAIARTVCKDSNIIIADEPTGNLDVKNADIVLSQLTNMKKCRHIIVVTHDLEKARQYGDRIITLRDGCIINDERINENLNAKKNIEKDTQESTEKSIKRNVDKKHNRLFWKSIIMVGANSIKQRKSRIISIALVIALSLSSLAMLIQFKGYGNDVSKKLNVNYLENDLASLFYEQTPNLAYKETPFDDGTIEQIKNKYKIKEIVPLYMEQNGIWNFEGDVRIKEAVIKQININEFFKERVMSNDISGEFIKDDNEIILASNVAKELFKDNCIGKKVRLNDGNGYNVELTVVGINNTINPMDQIYSYVSNEKVKSLLEKNINVELYNRLEVEPYYTENVGMKSDGFYGYMKKIDYSEKIVDGDNSKKLNEILISSKLKECISEDFDNENMFSKRLAINCNGVFEVRIAGVYESNEIEIRLSNELINEIKNLQPTMLEIYVDDTLNISEVKEKICNEEPYTAETYLESLKNNVNMQTKFFELALIVLGIIMMLISITMLSSFSKISVLERKREVAIMKCLGADDKNVQYTMWFDSVIISIIAFVISLIITGISIAVIPHYMDNIQMIYLTYPIKLLVCLGIAFMCFICIYTKIYMKKLVKKMPAMLLK